MKTISKALGGTVAAGAMGMTSISPAYARNGDGIGAGEIIAGALIIGGIAAVAASASNKGRDSYDYGGRYGSDSRYGRGDSRSSVDMCVRAAENTASRNSYGRAKVTDVRQINRKRDGYDVKGRIAVNNMGRAWRSGDPRYGRGWNNDYRGWNSNYRGYDSGSFTCKIRYGRVVDIDFKNIRGL